MKIDGQVIVAIVLPVFVAGCVSLGIGGGGDRSDPDIDLAMPTDTYDNCSGASNLLTSATGGGGGAVTLGMTECDLLNTLGDADEVTPQFASEGERRIIMVYANPNGGSTAYLFVDNALKEINLVK